jgi:hypothetical protein
MTIANIRAKMADAVTLVTGLTCLPNVPSVIHPPVAILKPTAGNWDLTLPRVAPEINWDLILIVPAAMLVEEAQTQLDSYLEGDQLKDAIQGADYLPDANYARVIRWRSYGEPVLEQYIGVILEIVTR